MKEEMSMKDIQRLLTLDISNRIQADEERIANFKIGTKVRVKSIKWFKNNCGWDNKRCVYYLIDNPTRTIFPELLIYANCVGKVTCIDMGKVVCGILNCNIEFHTSTTNYVWEDCFFNNYDWSEYFFDIMENN